jgi:hypothetical protein
LDTRIATILTYDEVYARKSELSAKALIEDLPSINLLKYISFIDINLYGYDNVKKDPTLLAKSVFGLLNYIPEDDKNKYLSALKRLEAQYGNVRIFYREANLRVYDLIFSTWNDQKFRTLSANETINFFNAYLITSSGISVTDKLGENKIKNAVANEIPFEDILLENFIYQTDYKSTSDFHNQISRAFYFTEFLSNSLIFKDYFNGYLDSYDITNKNELISSIVSLILECIKAIKENAPYSPSIVSFTNEEAAINNKFLTAISINNKIDEYTIDESFTIIRNFPLYKIADKTYLILEINFLIDKLYKNFVFSFSKFLDKQGYKVKNYHTIKGKEFMQDYYFYKLIPRCFNNLDYKLLTGGEIEREINRELSDYLIKSDNKIALLELKDVILTSKVKNEGDIQKLFEELDLKMKMNTTAQEDPTDVQQLIKAIVHLDKISNILETSNCLLDIYPIIVYTDECIGFESLSKRYCEQFLTEISSVKQLSIYNIHPLIFINLNFFELLEDKLISKELDFFPLLDGYYKFISAPENANLPFERYVRMCIDKKGLKPKVPPLTLECFKKMANESGR